MTTTTIAWWGLVFGEDAARGEIQAQLQDLMGQQSAGAVQVLLASVREPAEGLTATAVGLALLLVGATTVFAELQNALDRIWQVPGRLRKSGCPAAPSIMNRHLGRPVVSERTTVCRPKRKFRLPFSMAALLLIAAGTSRGLGIGHWSGNRTIATSLASTAPHR